MLEAMSTRARAGRWTQSLRRGHRMDRPARPVGDLMDVLGEESKACVGGRPALALKLVFWAAIAAAKLTGLSVYPLLGVEARNGKLAR